ncbi:hypothetical protein Lal_00002257 [Lupinus albus]|nr:hypothetical protein Lal_00002257 [Lupinus albus]
MSYLQCMPSFHKSNEVAMIRMDPSSPGTIEADYYIDILANHGLFTSDKTLLTNTETAKLVNQNAKILTYGQPNWLIQWLRWVKLVS